MDAACKTEGLEQGITSALAFVAATDESAISRFDDTGATWVRADGVVLWEQASDVAVKDGPLAPILSHADGTVSPGRNVWGGAMGPDRLAEASGIDNCVDWSFVNFSVSIRGLVGVSSLAGGEFFNESPSTCSEATAFYCFEE